MPAPSRLVHTARLHEGRASWTIELAENSSTGYRWLLAGVPPALAVVEHPSCAGPSDGSDVVGGPRPRTWTVLCDEPGTFAFDALLLRPWGDRTPIERVHCVLTVEPTLERPAP